MRVLFLCLAMIYTGLVIAGCATGNPGDPTGQDIVCADGEAWVYSEMRLGLYADGYIFRDDRSFCYVQNFPPGVWSNDCRECYCGNWDANGVTLTLAVDQSRYPVDAPVKYVRYTVSGAGGLTLYEDDGAAFLVKVGNVNVLW